MAPSFVLSAVAPARPATSASLGAGRLAARRAPAPAPSMRLPGGAGLGQGARSTGTRGSSHAARALTRGLELQECTPPDLSEVAAKGPLSQEEVEQYYQEGYIIVRGLVKGDLLDRVLAVRRECDSSFKGTEYECLAFQAWQQYPVFKEVALSSDVARVVAQLTPDVASGAESLHVIRDAVFVFRGDPEKPKSGCGWHVDDAGFWPAKQGAPGPGVNVWLALDEVTEDRGGMCIVPGSHTEDWLDCRDAIQNKDTCGMVGSYPEGSARLDAAALHLQLSPGDAIVHTRYLFHRTDPFVPGSEGEKGSGIARYTIRYNPGNALTESFKFKDGKFEKEESGRLDASDPERFPRVPL